MADVRRPLVWGRSAYRFDPEYEKAGPWHVTSTLPDGTSNGVGLCGSRFGHNERSALFVATRTEHPVWSQRCCPTCVRLERTIPTTPTTPTEETR